MFKTRELLETGLCCSIAAILQLIPVFFSEVFIIFTILATVPIYYTAIKGPKLGFIAYFVSIIIIWYINFHEAIIFIFLNGLVGVSLGLLKFLHNKFLIALTSGVILSLSFIIVNFIIGIPLLGLLLPVSVLTIMLITIFSILYSFLYYIFLCFFISKLKNI